ncbi:MAG: hypothetical protein WCD24_03775 [Serratia inhibens]|uniref:hypothetical protein n=1 Tax=Serratia inhibens TaxID=2338073 RepID=UPI003C7BB315
MGIRWPSTIEVAINNKDEIPMLKLRNLLFLIPFSSGVLLFIPQSSQARTSVAIQLSACESLNGQNGQGNSPNGQNGKNGVLGSDCQDGGKGGDGAPEGGNGGNGGDGAGATPDSHHKRTSPLANVGNEGNGDAVGNATGDDVDNGASGGDSSDGDM